MLILILILLAFLWVFVKVAPALIIALLIVTGAIMILKEIGKIIDKRNK